jgi:glycosyltransferase involved in cell wall biosynthesis
MGFSLRSPTEAYILKDRRRDFLPAKVHVLLSTYNGTQFLAEQMQSILGQSYPVAAITIRDDGSADDTYSLARDFMQPNSTMTLIQGNNLGAASSFFKLLAHAGDDCHYFAFADQDDVWLPDKLQNAVSCLERAGGARPQMYCSRQEYVDEKLRHLGFSHVPRDIGFGNALVENVATGCTVVLNRAARQLVVDRAPARVIMHDWWFYLVIAAFGEVVYDDRPFVKYRLHGKNAIGAPTHALQKWSRGVARFVQSRKGVTTLADQAREFQRCFGDLIDNQQRRVLERFLAKNMNLRSRIAYSAWKDVWRQSRVDDAILRALIIAGRV